MYDPVAVKHLALVAAVTCLGGWSSHALQAQGTAQNSLVSHVGEELIACGLVTVTTTGPRGEFEATIVDPASRQAVTLVLERPDRFGPGLAQRIGNQRVCGAGRLGHANGQYRIVLKELKDLQSDTVVIPRPSGFGDGAIELITASAGPALGAPLGNPAPADYPEAAIRAERNGNMEVEAVIAIDGSVQSVRVRRSLDGIWGLDNAALDAVRRYRFDPVVINGSPVQIITSFLVSFPKPDNRSKPVTTISVFRGYPLTPAPEPLFAWKAVTGMKPVNQPKPKYTPDAMRRKLQGEVEMDVVVRSDGSVRVLRVVKSVDPFSLDLEAIRCAETWTFEPGRVNGSPVNSRAILTLEFRLH